MDGPLHERTAGSARWTFGVGSLLFMIAQIAFCLALLRESWFMGIFAVAIFLLPLKSSLPSGMGP